MRIERISDTQVKFVLMNHDLEERDINISELSHSSDKTQQLFKEIVQLAQDEGAFTAEGAPFLIEAMRVGVDSLAIMVTKMDVADLERRFSLSPAAKEHCRYKRSSFIDQPDYPGESSQTVFSFAELDMAAAAASAIDPIFSGESQLFKHDGQYFLWLLNETEDDRTTADLEAILMEFGRKHSANGLGRQYLLEHGETVIAEDAVSKLGLYNAD